MLSSIPHLPIQFEPSDAQRKAWLKRTLPNASDEREHIVYWIFDSGCSSPLSEGYVGVTVRPKARSLEHLRSGRFPCDAQIKTLMLGYAETCYSYEAILRPFPNMGWNIASGGARGNISGIPKCAETRRKIGNANRGNKRPDLSERNKTCRDRMFPRTCPHCNLTGRGPNMTRYHFLNCKKATS